jgi:leader peptidase (prepilin peptidase)/N-methyltransferase
MMSLIDIDHFLLPDSLTLPALAVALLAPLLYAPDSGLPSLPAAILGAAVGAGVLALINRVGNLVLRRFKDTKERLWPVGMDQVNLAALGGALFGWLGGLALAAASLLLNLLLRRPLRLPEGPLYALWGLALAGSSLNPVVGVVGGVAGSFIAAGAAAVLGAAFWWFRDLLNETTQIPPAAEADEPVAMGFGDVKLAAVLGALLGWQSLLVALFLAFVLGALFGLIGRFLGGSRVIPFGPYLALGGLMALFIGPAIITWYLGLLGVGAV